MLKKCFLFVFILINFKKRFNFLTFYYFCSMNEDYVEIGYTQKPHGVKGEIKILIEEEYINEMRHLEILFLSVRGNILPYFIDEVRGTSSFIVKFEDVDNKEAAVKIRASPIFMKRADLKYWEEKVEVELVYSHCTGYQVIDVNDGELGKLSEVVEYPQQELGLMIINGKEILIPLNEHTIQNIDKVNKKLTVEMPAGILDVYKEDENEGKEEKEEEGEDVSSS